MEGKNIKKIHGNGSTIVLTDEFLSSIPEKDRMCIKLFVGKSRKGTVVSERVTRTRGTTYIRWDNEKISGISPFRSLGFRFYEPEYEELPLETCPIEFIKDNEELILRGIIDRGYPLTEARKALGLVQIAMDRFNIFFAHEDELGR